MKVALVFDGLQMGGIEKVGLSYISILQNLNYDVTVINLNPSLNDLEKMIPKDVQVNNIKFPRRFAPEQYSQLIKKGIIYKLIYPIIFILLTVVNYIYRFYCKLAYKCCRKDYDIVVAFSSHFNDLTFVVENFLKTRKRIAWCHGAIYEYLLISDGYINLYNKIKNIVVLVRDGERELLITNPQLKVRIFQLYNPVSIGEKKVNELTVKKLKEKYGHFLLMVARFDYPYKDPYTVMQALDILVNKYHKADLNLVFVGDGPDLEKAKKFSENLNQNVKKNIHFVGKQYDVQNYYKAAYIYVQAGAATEGLPTTMIEAMNFNLPEVVTDVKVGPREILGDSEYGILCNPIDPNDMARKINKLVINKEVFKEYQHKEKERRKDFIPENIQKKLSNILKNI